MFDCVCLVLACKAYLLSPLVTRQVCVLSLCTLSEPVVICIMPAQVTPLSICALKVCVTCISHAKFTCVVQQKEKQTQF